MAIDYYAEADQIINALNDEGRRAEADTLRDLIAAGSTATEIFMAIRWQLKQIDSANRITNLTTKAKIRDLVAELDRMLS
jgi:hypothetical protein